MEPARTTAPSPQPAGGDENAPAAPSSFAELLRLVRSGRSPPGVRSPRAAPTGDTPTASSLPRPKKPWESRPAPKELFLFKKTYKELLTIAKTAPSRYKPQINLATV
uniref:Peroxisomal membrane protein PEX14-like KPWE domain-containing protein n=1 Tax=Anas platyrhynchos platyrhynchos TaxID=8840 RepID=A0A493TAK2_ANAPP